MNYSEYHFQILGTLLIILIFRLDGPRDVDSLFGKAKFFEMRSNFSGALELVNQVNYLYLR